jgi:acyl carrier protein
VPGELHVGGAGLARGYLRRPELTAQRFIAHPERPGERLYATGDLARYLEDGDIEYLGRIDGQVKIRGHRVELGEIEARARDFPGVQDAVVQLREDAPGDQRLVAYIVGSGIDPAALREFLKAHLPGYMVPAACVPLERLPLTANGKLDRRALPRPKVVSNPQALPRPGVEQAIAEIWQEVLGVPSVGLDDSFFDLGGHSLSLVQVHGKMRALLTVDLPVTKLFQYPTIRSLARHLTESGEPAAAISPTRDRAQRQRAAIARRRELAETHNI